MATLITKNSSTASSVPTAAQLVQGELAVNVTDKRLFTENSSGTVVELGTNPSTLALPNGTANGVAYLNGSKVLTTGSALTFNGTAFSADANIAALNGKVMLAYNSDLTGYAAFQCVGGSGTQSASWGLFGTGELMRLTSTGLGIGTSSPAAKLMVIGSGGASLYIDSSAGGNNIYDATNHIFRSNSGGSERMRLDSSGNLGLGVTPSAWGGSYKAIQFASGAIAGFSTTALDIYGNAYDIGAGAWRYLNSSQGATRYAAFNGAHQWFTAPSGTAGNAISFTQAMTLDASGNLALGATSANARLDVVGGSIRVNEDSIGTKIITVRSDYAGIGPAINVTTSHPLLFLTANTERARITSGGDLLVGTTNSSLTTGAGLKFLPSSTASQIGIVGSDSTDSSVTYRLYSTGAAAYRFYVGYGGTVYATNTTISSLSDQRLKENIQDIDVGLTAVMSLKPRKFDWKAGKGKDIKGDRGFIAQEFEQVFPNLVDKWADPTPEGEEPYKSVRQDLIPVLVKAIQELKAEFDAYKATHP